MVKKTNQKKMEEKKKIAEKYSFSKSKQKK